MKFALGVQSLIFALGMRALHHASDEIHGPNTIFASAGGAAAAATGSQENYD
jgi:hypothetical protein